MSRQSQAARSHTAANPSEWLVGAIKKNPEGLLLLAAGACLLMRKAPSLARMQGPADQQHRDGRDSGLSQAVSGAQDYASNMAERTKETVDSVAASASNYASRAGRIVSEQSERVTEQAQSAFHATANRVLQDQPLAIALAGIAAGAAVAAAFPATDFEREHLGPIGEQVTDAAHRVGDQVKEATAKAGEILKNAADQRGLNAEGLKEVASEVAGAFSSGVTGSSGAQGGQQNSSGRSDAGTRNKGA